MKILHEDICARRPRREKISGGDKGGKDEDNSSEEAKYVLDTGERGMHLGLVVPIPGRGDGIGAMNGMCSYNMRCSEGWDGILRGGKGFVVSFGDLSLVILSVFCWRF